MYYNIADNIAATILLLWKAHERSHWGWEGRSTPNYHLWDRNWTTSFIPKLPSGTGQAMADVMIKVLSEWGVKALSFDATSSNTVLKKEWCLRVGRNAAPERSSLLGLQTSYPWNSSWRGIQHCNGTFHWTWHFTFQILKSFQILKTLKDLKHFGRTFLSLTLNLE